MGILVFGTGKYYKRYRFWLEQMVILALLDNDKRKQALGRIDDHLVLSPANGIKMDYDYVYVLGKYAQDMRGELLTLGVKDECIHTLNDLVDDILRVRGKIDAQVFTNTGIEKGNEAVEGVLQQEAKNILLISHDLGISGAVVACQALGRVLKLGGYNVVMAASLDGALREQITADGIPVICDLRLKKGKLSDIDWLGGFQIIWINTVVMFHLLVGHNSDIPVIWWIHESEMIFQSDLLDRFNGEFFTKVDFSNVHVYGVSKLACHPFLKCWPNVEKIDILPLGIDDFYVGRVKKTLDSTFIMAVVGDVFKRKSQDIFLSAIEMLPEHVYRECEFWIIGRCGEDDWAKAIYGKAKTMDNVKMCGKFTREQMAEALRKIDAIVVPSREESFSIAAIEGLMYHTAVICADEQSIGVAPYVRKKRAGLLVPKENAKALSEAITWAVTHRQVWKEMGERGRLLYEREFSLVSFGERVEKCIRSSLQLNQTKCLDSAG